MSTRVKTHQRWGLSGEILHQHGNSDWHVANQTHTIRVGRTDKDNDEESHNLHDAQHPVDWGNLPTDRRNDYRRMVRTGEFQQPWHDMYYAKLAQRRRNAKNAEVVELDEAEFA